MNRREWLRAGISIVMLPKGAAPRGYSGSSPQPRGAELQAPQPTGLRVPGLRVAVLRVLDPPDIVRVQTGDADGPMQLCVRHGDVWEPEVGEPGGSFTVKVSPGAAICPVQFAAPETAMRRIHLRWRMDLPGEALVLGDAWERSYGDLSWLPMLPERVLPWYALIHHAGTTSGCAVRVGGAALAFWQVDPRGISLWLDVRNGGMGVRAGRRVVDAATIVRCHGREIGESAFAVARRLCREMAKGVAVPERRGGLSARTMYGSNDWYYAYGKNTEAGILRDATLMQELAPAGGPRPMTVVDDGYQDRKRFPEMARLAERIGEQGVTPGVWVRPLRASAAMVGRGPLLPEARWRGRAGEEAPPAYDPTLPEGMEAALAVVREAAEWGYQVIKHDFTTYELLGRWGSQMGASPAQGAWGFHDRSKTTAEVIGDLYRGMRREAGEDRLILGCNTVGHLAVGIFDAQRTGDDVSGRVWERTRRMGVNTLAFRLPQHGVFFSVDADCVPVTPEVPWKLTEQWLDLLAQSGSVLLVSPEPESVGAEQRSAIRRAFALLAGGGAAAEPVDWMASRTPEIWADTHGYKQYAWLSEAGADPFSIGVNMGEG